MIIKFKHGMINRCGTTCNGIRRGSARFAYPFTLRKLYSDVIFMKIDHLRHADFEAPVTSLKIIWFSKLKKKHTTKVIIFQFSWENCAGPSLKRNQHRCFLFLQLWKLCLVPIFYHSTGGLRGITLWMSATDISHAKCSYSCDPMKID